MKIEPSAVNVNHGLEKDTLAHNSYNNYGRKDELKTKGGNSAGFVLDIGNGADNPMMAMGSELKSAEEIAKQAGNINVSQQKDLMTVMASTMSKEDYAEFAKNGYSLSGMSTEEQVTSLDKLKAKLAQAGTVIEGYNDDLSADELKEITGSEILAEGIEEALKANDLPVNRENVQNITLAVEKAGNLKPLNDDTVKYMATNGISPSVDSIYKAEFSAGAGSANRHGGYYQDAANGYFVRTADTIEWDKLKEQAERIVKEAGFKADEETMENAKWLVEQGIPLTGRSITVLNEIKEIEFPIKQDDMIKAMAIGIADGREPSAAFLTDAETMADKAAGLVRDIEKIDDEALKTAVRTKEPLNLRSLRTAMQKSPEWAGEPKEEEKGLVEAFTSDEFITAKRQLEETRLAMTFEANLKLLRQGISIDTVPLSELVDKLKKAEKDYYDPILIRKGEEFESDGAKAEALDRRIGLYKENVAAFSALREIPIETVGHVSTEGDGFTARRVLEASEAVKARAESTYEALMTAPRSDMGDSIKKAFQNVDDILSDNGYELNESNRRAVRILGYAGMEINGASIDRVREADQALRQAVEAMTPAKTLEMIRNGDNPIDENIFSLRDRLNEGSPSGDTERYSKFLVRLERRGEISEDEKEAFIGMYRLFRQIEKSDGKLLGNVLDSGGSLTLRNLLSASRSNRVKGMDYGVDDDFGGLERLISRGVSISEQIDEGFLKSSLNQGSLDYLTKENSELLNKLSPYTLGLNEITPETTLGEIYDNVADRFKDRSVETLIDDYQDDQAEMLAARKVEDNVIEVLTEGNIEVTPDNLLAQDILMNQRGKTFNSLMERASAGSGALESRLREAAGKLIESFDGRESAIQAYEELREASDRFISETADGSVDPVDVRELLLLHKQIGLATRQARNESFEVPVEIEGQWTSINLKLVRDGEESGTVTATMETEGFGRIGAKFSLDGRRLNGYITGDNKEGLKKLAEKADELSKELSGNGREVRQLNFIDTVPLDLYRFAMAQPVEEPLGKADNRELYEIAKTFISVIQR